MLLQKRSREKKEKAVEMWKLLLQDYGNSKVRMEYHFQEVMLANRIYAMKEFHDEIGKDVFRLRHGIFFRVFFDNENCERGNVICKNRFSYTATSEEIRGSLQDLYFFES